MHAQPPGSSLSIPSMEMQTEPLASGGMATSSWRIASNRAGHFGVRIGYGESYE